MEYYFKTFHIKFIFFCSVTNYHKLNSLYAYIYYFSFCISEVRVQLNWELLLKISKGWYEAVNEVVFLSGDLTGEELASELT